MRTLASLRRRRLRRGVNPTVFIIAAIVAVACAMAIWRIRSYYLTLYEDTEVTRRQLAMLVSRRDALNARLTAKSADETEEITTSMQADLEEVQARLAAVGHVRDLTLATYRTRVSPLLLRLLRLPPVPP